MLTALTGILAFLSSFGPALLGYFSQKENNAQQLRLQQLQLEAAKEGHAAELAITDARADIQQQQSLYAYDAGATGNKFVDALRGVVRPYITLVIFHLWLAIEVALLVYGIQRNLDLKQLVEIVWSQETAALFAAVIGFWFGQRAVKYGAAVVTSLPSIFAPAGNPATPTMPNAPAAPHPAPAKSVQQPQIDHQADGR